ncbi:uncharacterized protein CCR75_005767 [Bremia lactucae]|uniref:Uncharacterized protein n=1 Tax=Bremia lactucae TaxID=4779 RepID=A0A976IC20_BRELC|nr:hypothetical protein CCR75_005767 [Bremia lactucae]
MLHHLELLTGTVEGVLTDCWRYGLYLSGILAKAHRAFSTPHNENHVRARGATLRQGYRDICGVISQALPEYLRQAIRNTIVTKLKSPSEVLGLQIWRAHCQLILFFSGGNSSEDCHGYSGFLLAEVDTLTGAAGILLSSGTPPPIAVPTPISIAAIGATLWFRSRIKHGLMNITVAWDNTVSVKRMAADIGLMRDLYVDPIAGDWRCRGFRSDHLVHSGAVR